MAKKSQAPAAVSSTSPPRAEAELQSPEDAETVPQDSFEAIYLRQATREFANDLDKLRNANDFRGERSVQTLVHALKQGTASFSEDEKQGISRG